MNVTERAGNYDQATLVLSLAKKQQDLQGQQVMTLLQSVAESTSTPQSSKDTTATLGNNINIHV